MADMTVTARADSVGAKRRVEGSRRVIHGSMVQPQNKYETGGFKVTAKDLGFDTLINSLNVAATDSTGKCLIVAERKSGEEYFIKFFSALGTELANESESMKEKSFEFEAIGK